MDFSWSCICLGASLAPTPRTEACPEGTLLAYTVTLCKLEKSAWTSSHFMAIGDKMPTITVQLHDIYGVSVPHSCVMYACTNMSDIQLVHLTGSRSGNMRKGPAWCGAGIQGCRRGLEQGRQRRSERMALSWGSPPGAQMHIHTGVC